MSESNEREELLQVLAVVSRVEQFKPGHAVRDTDVASELGIDEIEQVRSYFDKLEQYRWVEPEKTLASHGVMLTSEGRNALRDAGLPG